MQVIVNGQLEEAGAGWTVAELLANHQLPALRVAVEINENLVPRREFNTTPLNEGDLVEIVTFAGGG